MKLYRSAAHPTQWIAFGSETGWVMFPAEVNGWQKRKPARGVDPLYIREVPVRMAFNTGIPGAPTLAVAASASALTRPATVQEIVSGRLTERKSTFGVSSVTSRDAWALPSRGTLLNRQKPHTGATSRYCTGFGGSQRGPNAY